MITSLRTGFLAAAAAMTVASTTHGPITVRPTAAVSGREIRLRDISDAKGVVGDIILGAAALPGRSCTFAPGDIRLRLRAAHIDPKVAAIPAEVTVTTGGSAVSGNVLVTVAEAAIRKGLPWPKEDVQIEATSVPALPALHGTPVLVAGNPALRSAQTTVVPVTVSLADGSEAKTVEVTFRVKIFAITVVAAKPIAFHAVIGSEDVTLARVELGGDRIIAAPEAVIGQRAVNALPAGRKLTPRDIEDAPVVATNTEVTVRVNAGGAEVTSTGTTREEGRLGQMIRVHLAGNSTTYSPGRDIHARVADAQTVIVED